MTEQISRKDFLKLAGIAVLSIGATKIPSTEQRETEYLPNLIVFSSVDNKNGIAGAYDTITGTMSLFVGQPTEFKDTDSFGNSVSVTALLNTFVLADNQPVKIISDKTEKTNNEVVLEVPIKFIPEVLLLKQDLREPGSGALLQAATIKISQGSKINAAFETGGTARIIISYETDTDEISGITFKPIVNADSIQNPSIDLSAQIVRVYPLELQTSDTAKTFDLSGGKFYMRGRIKSKYRSEIESPESQLPPEMTEKYLSKFASTEEGIKQVNGVDTNVMFGIEADGTKKVIAMEMEIDGEMRMTRVGEYIDKAGISYYTYIEPKYSSEGRFSVTDKTSQILFGEPEGTKDVNMWNSLAKQLGFATAAEARDFVMIKNDGKLKFNVAYGERQGVNTKSPMTKLPHEANFNLPIELKTILTRAEYDAIPEDIRTNLSHIKWEVENEEGFREGRLLWVKENGQIVIYVANTGLETSDNLDPDRISENNKKYANSNLEKFISFEILRVIDLIDDGYHNEATYARQARYLLEIDGLTFKGTV